MYRNGLLSVCLLWNGISLADCDMDNWVRDGDERLPAFLLARGHPTRSCIARGIPETSASPGAPVGWSNLQSPLWANPQ